jgi:hypothetical protein
LGNVYSVTPAGVSTLQFNFIPPGGNCYGQNPGLIDGLAYDEGFTASNKDDTLWIGDDAGLMIHHVNLKGKLIASYVVPSDPRSGQPGCRTGIAVDGPFLWLGLQSGADKAPHDIVKVAKADPTKVLSSFAFGDVGIPGPEGLALDFVTVPGKVGLRSNQFGAPNQLILWDLSEQFFAFPLHTTDAYNVRINSVMDHSLAFNSSGTPITYGRNGTVTAYTDEEGRQKCGCGAGLDCIDKSSGNNILGYRNPNTCGDFSVNGQYTGGGGTNCGKTHFDQSCKQFLSYDGHPGFDYHAPSGIGEPIYAPAPGVVFIPSSDPLTPVKAGGNPIEKFNILAVDHGNGFTTWYLHLGNQETGEDFRVIQCPNQPKIDLFLPANRTRHDIQVAADCQIGSVGDKGVPGSPHLHFEVRVGVRNFACIPPACAPVDPYGWAGSSGTDPYSLGAFKAFRSNSAIWNRRLWQ